MGRRNFFVAELHEIRLLESFLREIFASRIHKAERFCIMNFVNRKSPVGFTSEACHGGLDRRRRRRAGICERGRRRSRIVSGRKLPARPHFAARIGQACHRPCKNARIRSFSTGGVSSMADSTILTVTGDEKFLTVVRSQLHDRFPGSTRMVVAGAMEEACSLLPMAHPRLIVVHWSRHGSHLEDLNRLLWATSLLRAPGPRPGHRRSISDRSGHHVVSHGGQ